MAKNNLKVLAIDDEEENLHIAQVIVENAFPNVRFFTALTGSKGIALALAEDPDVILLDIVMPKIGGFEVCRRLKADDRLKSIPVVFLTASRTGEKSRIEGLEAGGEGFLLKPLKEAEFLAQIRAMAKIKGNTAAQRREKERLALLLEERTTALEQEVAKHRQMEIALRESEDLHGALLEHARDSILLLELPPDGIPVIWDANAAAMRMYGYSREELLGKPISFLDAYPTPAKRAESDMGAVFEARHRRKDGSVFDLEVSVGEIKIGGKCFLIDISRDITGRKQLEMKLRERNDELTHFSYAVSHDLKSPLVTIKTFIGYLEEQDIPKQDSAAITKDFSLINTAADKMFRLLDELLALSRMERNIDTHIEISLREVIEEALSLVAGRISEGGVKTLIIDEMVTLFGVETVTLFCDRQRMLEVFQNLFDNAVKFMGVQPNPVIEAGVDLSGAEPVFFVRDNGIGIDPRHADKIFGLFEKLDSVTEGTGIGLALVSRVIKAHGGRIWVESEGPGKGTTFRFTLANTKKIAGGGCLKTNL